MQVTHECFASPLNMCEEDSFMTQRSLRSPCLSCLCSLPSIFRHVVLLSVTVRFCLPCSCSTFRCVLCVAPTRVDRASRAVLITGPSRRTPSTLSSQMSTVSLGPRAASSTTSRHTAAMRPTLPSTAPLSEWHSTTWTRCSSGPRPERARTRRLMGCRWCTCW